MDLEGQAYITVMELAELLQVAIFLLLALKILEWLVM